MQSLCMRIHPFVLMQKATEHQMLMMFASSAYLDLFSGAFGHADGCHDIWQFYSPTVIPVNGPTCTGNRLWNYRRASNEICARLLEPTLWLTGFPDQSLVEEQK